MKSCRIDQLIDFASGATGIGAPLMYYCLRLLEINFLAGPCEELNFRTNHYARESNPGWFRWLQLIHYLTAYVSCMLVRVRIRARALDQSERRVPPAPIMTPELSSRLGGQM